MTRKPWLFLVAALAVAPGVFAQPVCDGTRNDTAELQALADAGGARWLDPARTYCVDGRVGVNLPSGLRLGLAGASVGMNPGCAQAGFVCRIFNTRPNTADITIEGPGTIFGDPTLACATCWSILIRADSTSRFTLRNLYLRDTRSDHLWGGGNSKSRWIVLDRVVAERAGRNILSFVNADYVLVWGSILAGTAPGADPGACIDFEPNPGATPPDTIDHAYVIASELTGCHQGVVAQKGGGGQGRVYVVASNIIRTAEGRPGDRTPAMGLSMTSILGGVAFDNDIEGASWPGRTQPATPVPLAGTFAGPTAATLSSGLVLVGNRITGQVYDPGTALQVVTGDWRLAGVKDAALFGNVFTWGRITRAGLGTSGAYMEVGNELR